MFEQFKIDCPHCGRKLTKGCWKKCVYCHEPIKYCERCQKYISPWLYNDDMKRCENCINENFTLCRNCNEYFFDENVNEKKLCYFCENALRE